MRQRRRLVVALLRPARARIPRSADRHRNRRGAQQSGRVAQRSRPQKIAPRSASAGGRPLLAQETTSRSTAAKRLVAVRVAAEEGGHAARALSRSANLALRSRRFRRLTRSSDSSPTGSSAALDVRRTSTRRERARVFERLRRAHDRRRLADTASDCRLGSSDLGGAAFQARFVASAHASPATASCSRFRPPSDAVIERARSRSRRRTALRPSRLAALEAIVRRHGLDGVNIDLEGTAAKDARGFVGFVTDLVGRLRAARPTG